MKKYLESKRRWAMANKEYIKRKRKEKYYEDLHTSREKCRVASAERRKSKPRIMKKYIKNYFKVWRVASELNTLAHAYRCIPGSIKRRLLTTEKYGRIKKHKISADKQLIEKNLLSVGWDPHMDSDMVLNHIISIALLLEFNLKLDRTIIYDKNNLEIITKELNNSAEKRTVGIEQLDVAERMEKIYPECRGLVSFIKSKIGQLK